MLSPRAAGVASCARLQRSWMSLGSAAGPATRQTSTKLGWRSTRRASASRARAHPRTPSISPAGRANALGIFMRRSDIPHRRRRSAMTASKPAYGNPERIVTDRCAKAFTMRDMAGPGSVGEAKPTTGGKTRMSGAGAPTIDGSVRIVPQSFQGEAGGLCVPEAGDWSPATADRADSTTHQAHVARGRESHDPAACLRLLVPPHLHRRSRRHSTESRSGFRGSAPSTVS